MNTLVATKRIGSIDVLRGFALLGILIMNIQSFGLLQEAYFNPLLTLSGVAPTSIDLISHGISAVLADQKFMTIFSLLFGASLALQFDRGSSRMKLVRRNLVLLLIGLVHAYLIWHGDILVTYAICGFIAIASLQIPSRWLCILAPTLFLVPPLITVLNALFLPFYNAAQWQEILSYWNPEQQVLVHQVEAMQGSWIEQMPLRIEGALEMQLVIFSIETGWRVLALMLFGIVLFRSQFFNRWPKICYRKTAFGCLLIGFLISALDLQQSYQYQWQASHTLLLGSLYNYFGSLLVALGYSAVVLLICQYNVIPYFKSALATVGRTALSNYFLQSIICTMLFYGHGFGMYAQWSRAELWLLLIPIWLFQITVSSAWLKRYHQGPLEWLWRSAASSH